MSVHRVAPTRLKLDLTARSVFRLLVGVGALWLLSRIWVVFVLVLVSLLLVGFFLPFVQRLEARGIRRSVALLVVVLGLVACLAVVGILLGPPLVVQAARLLTHAPEYQARFVHALSSRPWLEPLARAVRTADIGHYMVDASGYAVSLSRRVATIVGYAVTALFLAFYLIADRERTREALFSLTPSRYHAPLERILHKLPPIVGGYMIGQVITSVLIAIFTAALLAIAGVPNALALGVFAGLMDAIPYIGATLAIVPCVLFALTRGWGIAIAVLVAMLVYQEFENRVLMPRIYGRTLRLSAALVVVALLTGAMLLGVLGALLALPVVAALIMIVKELRVDLPGERPMSG